MTVKRMDNVGIVVESLDTAIAFFADLGLELEGRATIPQPARALSISHAVCGRRSPGTPR